jgi:hypothetical protein
MFLPEFLDDVTLARPRGISQRGLSHSFLQLLPVDLAEDRVPSIKDPLLRGDEIEGGE